METHDWEGRRGAGIFAIRRGTMLVKLGLRAEFSLCLSFFLSSPGFLYSSMSLKFGGKTAVISGW